MSSTINQDSILSGKVSTQEVPLSGKVSTQEMLLSGTVSTLETLIGPPGPRGRGWYQDVVDNLNPQIYMWTVGSLAPKWGEGDWLYDPDNGNVGLCTSRTDKADGSGSASITYKGTLKGKDGTKWWTYAYPIGITAALENIMSKSNLPDAAIGDYVLHTMSNAGIVFEITGETADGSSWVVKEKCTLRGKDGTTPHIGENGNWYIGDTDTGVSAGGASHVFNVTVVTGTGPDSLSADKTFAEIKSAYTAGNTVVVRQGSALYELTYMSDVRAEFTRVNETYYDVLSCTNSGAPQEVDIWQLNRTKRLNYDTKYRDIGLKTVPVAIKELQDKSAPTVTDADAGKYLHVNASTKKLEWAEVKNGGSGLPAVTAADAGKFLRVNSSGSWVAETVANASGGEF